MTDIVGFVGQITPNKVSGWAMDKNAPDQPLKLQLRINDQTVASGEAQIFRKDLLEKGIHPNGRCGFSFHFPYPVYDYQLVAVYEDKTGSVIPWSGALAQRERAKISSSTQQFFFIHIPKTAGTSFRTMLYRQFDQKTIYPQFKDIRNNSNFYNDWSKLSELKPEQLEMISLLTGHYPFSAQQFLDSDHCQVITVLRDPVKRVCSLLAHLQRHNKQFSEMSLEEIFQQELGAANGMTRLFINDFSKVQLEPGDLQEAKANLEQCALIGLSERFEETVRLAEKKFGWNLGEPVTINVGSKKYEEAISPELLEMIRRENELDLALYVFATELFSEEIAAAEL